MVCHLLPFAKVGQCSLDVLNGFYISSPPLVTFFLLRGGGGGGGVWGASSRFSVLMCCNSILETSKSSLYFLNVLVVLVPKII